jgi:hypothetical protein
LVSTSGKIYARIIVRKVGFPPFAKHPEAQQKLFESSLLLYSSTGNSQLKQCELLWYLHGNGVLLPSALLSLSILRAVPVVWDVWVMD